MFSTTVIIRNPKTGTLSMAFLQFFKVPTLAYCETVTLNITDRHGVEGQNAWG